MPTLFAPIGACSPWLKMVGVLGIEPRTLRSQSECATSALHSVIVGPLAVALMYKPVILALLMVVHPLVETIDFVLLRFEALLIKHFYVVGAVSAIFEEAYPKIEALLVAWRDDIASSSTRLNGQDSRI